MRPRKKVHELKLKVGDSVAWPDNAIVLVEDLDGGDTFRTIDLDSLKRDWLTKHDWIDGDYTVVRMKRT